MDAARRRSLSLVNCDGQDGRRCEISPSVVILCGLKFVDGRRRWSFAIGLLLMDAVMKFRRR